jgi:hypothetical protein
VAGPPAAALGPVAPQAWRHWDDVQDVFREPVDSAWGEDLALLDGAVADPWERG